MNQQQPRVAVIDDEENVRKMLEVALGLEGVDVRSVVWGNDRDTSTQTVETYISYLRTKINEAAQPALIQTVREVGYVLR